MIEPSKVVVPQDEWELLWQSCRNAMEEWIDRMRSLPAGSESLHRFEYQQEEMMRQFERLKGKCEGKDCPAFWNGN